MTGSIPRYEIRRQAAPRRAWRWLLPLTLGWAASLVAVWQWTARTAAPGLDEARAELHSLRDAVRRAERELVSLRQREATLQRSDQITRTANREVQRALAERDGEIADLRANLAFYERLVGSTAKPRGLAVHSAEFAREDGGTWRYEVVLTQSLNRGAVSAGQLRLAIEGVRAGKLVTLRWDDLLQRRGAPGQAYSFRYFQQLAGSVMLPAGFTPQRVRVSLQGDGAQVEQVFAWSGRAAAPDGRLAALH